MNKNGNITAQAWQHRLSGQNTQTYKYNYDYLDRVNNSVHGQLLQNTFIDLHNYDEKFTYDQRGNITSLNRKGMIKNPLMGSECYSPSTIDSLAYNYQPGSNKLIQVVDKAPCQDTFVLPKIIDRDASYAANQLIIADQSLLKVNADIKGTKENLTPKNI